jgi:hypothetical protein
MKSLKTFLQVQKKKIKKKNKNKNKCQKKSSNSSSLHCDPKTVHFYPKTNDELQTNSSLLKKSGSNSSLVGKLVMAAFTLELTTDLRGGAAGQVFTQDSRADRGEGGGGV